MRAPHVEISMDSAFASNGYDSAVSSLETSLSGEIATGSMSSPNGSER